MAKSTRVSETPATAFLKAHGVAFTEHPYEYLEHGGAQHSAEVLGLDPFTVVKTLVMQDDKGSPLIVLMHGNRSVSTKNLARQIGAKSVEPCAPETANRHSGYLVGGTSPFATRRRMPVYIERSILTCPGSASTAADEATSSASTPKSACACSMPSPSTARCKPDRLAVPSLGEVHMISRRSMFGLLAVLAGLFAHPAASASGPEAIVQAQLAAYNARDLNAFSRHLRRGRPALRASFEAPRQR